MNIKKSKYLFPFSKLTFAIAMLIAIVFTSCDTADLDEPEAPKMHTCKMVLNVQKPDFENTRAGTANWKDGDKIYLRFTGGSDIIYGEATYSSGIWTVSYTGNLSVGSNRTCCAVYVENPAGTEDVYVLCNPNYGIYVTDTGVYSYDGTVVSVTASLTSKTGRIRFKGMPGETIEVHGIWSFYCYEPSTDLIYFIRDGAALTVESNGYTPYLYGVFSSSNPYVAIETSDAFYMKDLPTTMYRAGESGFMNIPTKTSHSSWIYNERKEVKLNGVTYPFVKVANSDGTSFYLMQTEVTNQQYNSVMKQTSSEAGDLPALKTFKNFWDMATALSDATGLDFRIPSHTEWCFASKGGLNSKGYKYSGSNVLTEVAWCPTNSKNQLSSVKLLRPNELGLYDMNGNLAEFVMLAKDATTNYLPFYGGSYNTGITSYDTGFFYSSTNVSELLNSSYTHGIRLAVESFN